MKTISLVVLMAILTGCTTEKPRLLIQGKETIPPLGCIEARTRGIKC